MQKILLTSLSLLFYINSFAQHLEPVTIDDAWLTSIKKLAPSKTRIATKSKRKILIFSTATGFKHWTIPHNIEMLKILAKKTKAFEIQVAYDIHNFTQKNLKQYDAVVLNNSNPKGPKRDLFFDLLKANTSLTDTQIKEQAAEYEKNLIRYITKGGGLMVLHGAIVIQNNSSEFSKMTGASFDYHPKQQSIHLKEVDKNHPLVQAFKGKGFTHVDEPYFFKNAYFDYNFKPLLYFDNAEIEGIKHKVDGKINYVSWIKKHGKGRVFYTSPSHNAQSLNKPELLQFFLDGLQYVVGDLKCDDTPLKKIN